ncbi:MAG: MFS transporter [Candidatus Caldatribacterium sp.]|nr:MFS transporter [Candidatus Caldatribacterium sp.]
MLSRRDYIFNFFVDSLDYAFFSLALSFGSVTTFLPLFAKRLGAGNIEIGLIPALAYLGWSLPALWGAKVSQRLSRKLPFILRVTLFERLPFFGIALVAAFYATSSPRLALYLVLLFLAVACSAMGFLGPIWTEMIGKVIHSSRWGLYFACGNGIGALMGIWGSQLAERLIASYPFAWNFALCFFLASLAMGVSYVFLSLTREEDGPVTDEGGSYLRSFSRIVREDPNFLLFLVARVFLALGVMGAAFYTVSVLGRFSIQDTFIARYNAVLLVSQALSNFFWGPLGDKRGHKLVLLCGTLAILLSNLWAILAPSPGHFFLAFGLLGLNYSAVSVGGVAILLDFAPPERRWLYLGWGSFFSGFPAFFAPILGGKLADLFGYTTVFWVSLLLNALGLALLLAVREPRAFENFAE